MNLIQQFLTEPQGLALAALMIGAAVDWITGTAAAVRDGTFDPEALAAWVRKHIAGRVIPLGTVLVTAYLAGSAVPAGTDPGEANLLGLVATAVNAVALGGAATYVAELLASIRENLTPPPRNLTKAAALERNPVPED